MRLDRLHNGFQIVMDWTDSHLHAFTADDICYGQRDYEWDPDDTKMIGEEQYSVSGLVSTVSDQFVYEYDFGDGWEHDVVLEELLPQDTKFRSRLCQSGANACPPEDCGGSYGSAEFVDAMADPKHEEHNNMKQWFGGSWHPIRSCLEEVNAELKKLKA